MSGAALRRNLFVIAGLTLLLLSIGLFLASPSEPSQPSDFGWFAYTPLDGGLEVGGGDRSGPFVIVSQRRLIAGLVAAAGLVVLAAGIGYRVGRRYAASPAAPDG